MCTLNTLIFLLSCTSATAIPLLGKRLDLDGNGVPDECNFDSDGTAHCMEAGGYWIAVLPSSNAAVTPSSPATTYPPPVATTASSSSPGSSSQPSPTTSLEPTLPIGSLPAASQFKSDNGTKWKIEYVGDVQYTDQLSTKDLTGDKCRSSLLGDTVIWNCGDMMCSPDYTVCGFSMGPAMYGTDDVMTINTTGISDINNNDFLSAWIGDSTPQEPHSEWGLDQSNVAPLNDTHGVVYGFQIWRGAWDGSIVPQGNAVGLVTLDADKPVATRMGPLLTGPDAAGMGLLAILRDEDYIYLYTEGGPSRLVVTRVAATDDVFDASKYESLLIGTTTWATGIPSTTDTEYGMTTANESGQFGCSVYGSVFFSNYFNKYVIICNIFMTSTNMYTSDTPYGPWSEEYGLLSGWVGYGSMAHPMYSPGGSHKEVYFSQGPNSKFNMFKLTFDY